MPFQCRNVEDWVENVEAVYKLPQEPRSIIGVYIGDKQGARAQVDFVESTSGGVLSWTTKV